MKRLVGYIRQSLQDAASSSPERQAEIIETWAKSRDLVITRIYKDIGGKRSEDTNVKTRKDFPIQLKDADARKFDIIVVASQERFGTLTTLGSSEGPVATGEPGKAAASDDLLSPVPPRADATGAEETGSRSPSPKPRNPVVLSQINLNIPSTGASRGDCSV